MLKRDNEATIYSKNTAKALKTLEEIRQWASGDSVDGTFWARGYNLARKQIRKIFERNGYFGD